MIYLNNISKSFSHKLSKKVLTQINLKLESKKIYAFYGSNGSGKTTLFKIIAGLIVQDSGSVKFEPSNSNVCYVASNQRAFINRITAYENLDYFFTARTGRKLIFNERFNDMANILGLSALLNRNVSDLSTGEIQKLSILRAITYEPNILILDESFVSIDEVSVENIIKILKEELRNNTLENVLISSHDINFLEKFSDMILHMESINVN
jgi:ABC-2 type transport system ATP-binding protein